MWLIDTYTLGLKEFPTAEGLEYAILSHRWEEDELKFEDMQPEISAHARQKKGFKKVQDFCRVARARGHQYGWADTCCINKLSSAELSESINSMFHYYQLASECIVFMCDVSEDFCCIEEECSHKDGRWKDEFKASAWFERGWTLQELLAPRDLVFYNKHWIMLKSLEGVVGLTASVTRIDESVLLARASRVIFEMPVAVRMSWAASRKTTRPEDRAYSLLGIFNVNMPMLYGEGGEKAFLRLQEEIMKSEDDHSIFVWSATDTRGCGMLSDSLDKFRNSSTVSKAPPKRIYSLDSQEYHTLTNAGLSIELPLRIYQPSVYVAKLSCREDNVPVYIFLRRMSYHVYTRVPFEHRGWTLKDQLPHLSSYEIHESRRRIFVRKKSPLDEFGPWKGCAINFNYGLQYLQHRIRDSVILGSAGWDREKNRAAFEEQAFGDGHLLSLDLKEWKTGLALAHIFLDFDSNPCIVVNDSTKDYSKERLQRPYFDYIFFNSITIISKREQRVNMSIEPLCFKLGPNVEECKVHLYSELPSRHSPNTSYRYQGAFSMMFNRSKMEWFVWFDDFKPSKQDPNH